MLGRSWKLEDAALASEGVPCPLANSTRRLEDHKAGSELIADMGTKALAGPKLKDLKKKAGMMAEPQTKVNRINEVKLDMAEIEKYKQALAVIACCLQVQGTSAMEDEKVGKEKDEALIRFGIMVAVFTVIAMKIVEKCGAACSRALPVVRALRVGGEREVDPLPGRVRDEQADAPEEGPTRSGGIGKFVYYRRRRGVRKITDYRRGGGIGKFVYYRRRHRRDPRVRRSYSKVEPREICTKRKGEGQESAPPSKADGDEAKGPRAGAGGG